ncbi:hypothetical protein WJX82_006875 [Trebouxia sp. C0006]
MAPKKNKAALNDTTLASEEQQAALALSQRLQAVAKTQRVVAGARRVISKELPTPKLLLKADGKDLIKKSSQRKGRYLLNICAQIAPAAAGKLGTLAQLDSQNPVLYVDFPQGRLKFLGTIIFPKNKYMLLKFGQKDVLCEDIFDNMIIFPEAHWVGTREENPTEKELPMPAELQSAVIHEKYSFGSEANQTGTATQPSQTQPSQVQAEGEDEDGSSSNDELDGDEAGPSQPTRISSRHKGKRPLYTEPGNSGSDAEAIDLQDTDGEGEETVRKLPKLSQQGTPSQSRRRKSSGLLEDLSQPKAKVKSARNADNAAKTVGKATARRGVVASSSDEDEEDAAPVPAAKKGGSVRRQPTLNAFLSQSDSGRKGSNTKLTSGKGTSASAKGKKKVEEVIDLLDDDPGMASQDVQGSPLPVSPLRQLPRRARASKANSLTKFTVSNVGSLPSSVIDGIDSLRNIEKVAGETSASQASLLKQLSELEQALISVTSSLPSTEFVAQLDKLQSVQLRLQGVLNRLSIVEARTVKIQAYLSNSAK